MRSGPVKKGDSDFTAANGCWRKKSHWSQDPLRSARKGTVGDMWQELGLKGEPPRNRPGPSQKQPGSRGTVSFDRWVCRNRGEHVSYVRQLGC